MSVDYRRLLKMNNKHIRKLVYEHTSIGRRNTGRPKKRWKCKQPSRRNKPPIAYTMLLTRISSFAPILYNKKPCRLDAYIPPTLPTYFLLLKRHRGLLQELWRGDIRFLHQSSVSRNK